MNLLKSDRSLAVAFACCLLSLFTPDAIATTCSIAGGDVDFGISPGSMSAQTAASDLAITCVGGPARGTLSYSIRVSSGQNGSVADRQLRNPDTGRAIRYQIYRDTGHTLVWGDTLANAATGIINFNGAGFSTSTSGITSIRTKLNAQDVANAAAGMYSDSLVVTIEF